ncbi:MAG: DUF2784 domain-containing protein [candidate division Zixibacteria bacterium]|nr:DUF2784 domain-containing protein [candidate division Zixibacteria bacterium]
MSRFWADTVVVAHFLWVVFMIGGSVVQMIAMKSAKLREWCVIRAVHVAGILYVAILTIIGRPCPLTVWEAQLRRAYDGTQPESFLVRWLERLLYPDVDPLVVYIPTIVLAILSVLSMLVAPPGRLRRLLSRN